MLKVLIQSALRQKVILQLLVLDERYPGEVLVVCAVIDVELESRAAGGEGGGTERGTLRRPDELERAHASEQRGLMRQMS